jgi:hypothetical protein
MASDLESLIGFGAFFVIGFLIILFYGMGIRELLLARRQARLKTHKPTD